jgi:uncharacterized membrane protein YkoI
MSINYALVRVSVIILSIVLPLSTALADDDYVKARRLLESGEILPLEEILNKVKTVFPGRVLEVELETEHHQVVYELEILGKNGVIREIAIDAKTGELLSNKEDD